MALIETEEAAGRLARVIVSDIEIYNRQKIASGGDLTRELEEGFSLFQSRVVPALLPLFESVLSDRGLLGGKLPPSLAKAAARYAELRAAAPPAAEAAVAEVAAAVVAAPAPAAPAVQAPAPEPTPEPVSTDDAATTAAKRLARVIVSDIVIYNTKKIAAGADLTNELNEGRALFRSRVAAEHLGLLEALLAERGLVRARPARAPTPAGLRAPTPSGVRVPTPAGLRAPTPAGVRVPTPTGLRAPTPAGVRVPTPAGLRAPTPAGIRVPTPTGIPLTVPRSDTVEMATPVVEVAPFLERSEPVLAPPAQPAHAHDAATPVVEPVAAILALPRTIEPADAESAAARPDPFAEPAAAEGGEPTPPPSNDWDGRPRSRPLPPPIPVEARVQAVRAAALELPKPEPRDADDNGIMTSALELPVATAPEPAPASPLAAALESMKPLPAPTRPAAVAPAALVDAPAPDTVLAPLRAPAKALAEPGKKSKTRLLVAATAILTAAAITYYLLSFWPTR